MESRALGLSERPGEIGAPIQNVAIEIYETNEPGWVILRFREGAQLTTAFGLARCSMKICTDS